MSDDLTASPSPGTGSHPVFPTRARRRIRIVAALVLADVVALLMATFGATLIRFGRVLHVPTAPQLPESFNFFDLSLAMTLVWLVALFLEGLYDLDRVFWGTGEYSRVFKALAFGVVGLVLLEYTLKIAVISRGWTLLALALGCVLVMAGRALVRVGLVRARRRGRMLRPTLIVGFNQEAADMIRALRKNPTSGLVPVACLASSKVDRLELDFCTDEDIPCIGSAREIREVVTSRYIDTVIISSTAFEPDAIARIINDLRDLDLDIQLSSGLFDVTTSRVLVREMSGVPLITIRSVSFALWKRAVKRTFDLVVGGAILTIGLPVWLLIALAIKLDSRGPVLYRQRRVGRGGTEFDMLKFRSMCSDADAKRAELATLNEATGPLFKIKDDPRVTRVGKWMRTFSVDEFPQLINVMLGQMSLVGPRPPLPSEVAAYTEYHWRRMEVLPGMTGLWQVSGRSKLTFEEMVRLDLFYIENWSVGFDLGLLMRTIPAVVLGSGAY